MYKEEREKQEDRIEKVKEGNERTKEMNDLRSDHFAIHQEAQH